MTRDTVLAVLLIALLGAVASQLRFTSNLDRVLPADSGTARSLHVADAFHATGDLLFDIDGSAAGHDALAAAVDRLAADLAAYEDIDAVRARMSLDEAIAVRGALAPHAAALVPAPALAERTSAPGMQQALVGALGLLSGPAGGLAEERVRSDPLGIEALALRGLEAGSGSARVRGGLLVDTSGDHALVIARTGRPVNDTVPGDPWVAGLRSVLDAQPLPVAWLGAHRFADETATAVRADVQRAVAAGTLALVLVLLLGFRSLRPVAGAAVPIAVALLGTAAGAALVAPVHGVQIAFVGALAGVAADYWIHLYVAAARRTPAGAQPSDRREAALRARSDIAVALGLSAGSTALAFAVLLGSDLPMVRDLGVMGVCTVGAAFAGTWLLGPSVFAAVGAPSTPTSTRPAHALTVPVLAALAALALLAPGAGFDAEPRDLMAPSPATQRAEQAFADRWGLGGPQGLVVIEGAEAADVLDRAATVEAALAGLGVAAPIGPAAVLPGPDTVARRRAALPDAQTLDRTLAGAAAEVGFAPFEGVGARVHATAGPVPVDAWAGTLVQERVDRHLRIDEAGAAVLISVPLVHPDAAPALADTVAAADPDAKWIVPTELARAGLRDTLRELGRFAPIGAVLIVVLLWLRFRDAARVARTLAPAAAGLVAAAGGTALLGLQWNVVSVAVCVLLIGLALDYGVFTEAGSGGPDTRRAIGLGALTTVAGFGGLLVAQAPSLRGVGVALCFGVTGAAVTALVVLPASMSADPWPGKRVLRWCGAVAWLALVAVHLDLLLGLATAFRPPLRHPSAPTHTLQGTPGDRRFGDNRLVRDDGVWLLSTTGTPYEAGYAAGILTEDLRERLETELFASFRRAVPNPAARWLVTRGSLVVGRGLPGAIRPEHLAQLQGDADAVPDRYRLKGDAFTRKVYYHAIHDIGQALVDTPFTACTGFAAGGEATADGHWILARNFDFEGGVTFDRDKVIWVYRPDDGIPFVAVGFSGLVGVVSGLNADGLAVAIHAGGSDAPIRPGTPMTLIVREVLQTASSLDEAEAILRARTGFVSENVLVVDGDAGEAALFEVSPERVERLDVDGHLAVSNHFRHPAFAGDATNARRMEEITTVPRLARMEQLVERHHGRIDLRGAATILRDRRGVDDAPLPRGHRHALDAGIATHGVVIDATARVMWVSRYPNLSGGFVSVSLSDLLAGDLDAAVVLAADPDAAAALDIARGRDLVRRARSLPPAAAVPLLSRAADLMPGHPEPSTELGLALHALGRDDEARPLLRAALDTPPEYAHQVRAIEEVLR